MYTRWLNFLNNKRIILGSGSPQRKQILEDLGLKFEVRTSDFAEDLEKTTPRDYVQNTSNKKFEELVSKYNELDMDILITADTIIEYNDQILEKPKNEEEIYEWFHKYSNDKVICLTHVVIGIIRKNEMNKNYIFKKISFTNESKIFFDEIDNEMIADYIKTGEPFNRAGGFAIQGYGKFFIKKIEGCYFNIVGFPAQEYLKNLMKIIKEVYGENSWIL